MTQTRIRNYGCCVCQARHYDGDPLFQGHIWHQSKHGISNDVITPANPRYSELVPNADPFLAELWAKNLLAEAEFRNNVVRARNGDPCYYATPAHIVDLMDTLAAGPEPDAETMAATEAGIEAAFTELGIDRP